MLVSTPSQIKLNESCSNEDFNSISSVLVWVIIYVRGLICVSGQTGLGKSTLINTIFAAHLIDSKGRLTVNEPVRQTTEIQAVSHGATLV
jgi:predicted GTPase